MPFISDIQKGVLALISGGAALVGPTLALVRWIQEKSIDHRYREEMRRSNELLDFIQRCPETLSAAGTTESTISDKTREELARCLNNISRLLGKKAAKAAPPIEIAWPRRLLLLYAPRTLAATALHTLYHVATILYLLMLIAAGYNEKSDTFQWNEYTRLFFDNPVFITGLAFWLIPLWTLWYIATTKDHWDKTLPIGGKQPSSACFLAQTPVSVRDLLARILLIWSALTGIVLPLLFGGPTERFLKTSPLAAPIFNALPDSHPWEKVLCWAVVIFCPALAHLWAKAEFEAFGRNLWLPFPHNFRFFYPALRLEEIFSQYFLVLVAVNVMIRLFRIHSLSILFSTLPDEIRDEALFGLRFALLEQLISVILIFYGCYRLGLINYMKWREARISQSHDTVIKTLPETS